MYFTLIERFSYQTPSPVSKKIELCSPHSFLYTLYDYKSIVVCPLDDIVANFNDSETVTIFFIWFLFLSRTLFVK